MLFGSIKNASIVIISGILGHFLATPFAALLAQILDIGGSFLGDTLEYYIFGLPMIVGFLLALFFQALGGKSKYVWLGITLIPIILFEVQLAPILVIYSIILIAVALGLGYFMSRTLWKLAPGVMAKIG